MEKNTLGGIDPKGAECVGEACAGFDHGPSKLSQKDFRLT